MNSVFIGGSRRISRMNPVLSHRLDNIMQNQLSVLIGDANGFDRLAQAYFAQHMYREIVVYCTAGECRNNVGDWPKHVVEYKGRDRGLQFYTAKDDAMLRDGGYGFFAWDGQSKGTLRNIQKMAEQGKPSVVYVSSRMNFITVRNSQDAAALLTPAKSGTATPADLFSDTWRAEVG